MDRLDTQSTESQINLDDPANYIGREMSTLEFQRRVLEEVQDSRNPLLERVKFTAIFGSNLEEFFMVRVGGLKDDEDAGSQSLSMDGMTPTQELVAIRKVAQALMNETQDYLRSTMWDELHHAGIHLKDYHELNLQQKESADSYFNEVVFPTLTPLAFDPGHPFPFISNLSFNLAVLIKGQEGDGVEHFARIKIPDTLPYLVPVPTSLEDLQMYPTGNHTQFSFVWISQLIRANLDCLFPGMEILESHPFHVTRNAEVEIPEDEGKVLLETMEEGVRKRRFGTVVRLLVNKGMPKYILDLLADNLKMDRVDIYEVHGPLVLHNLMQLYKIDRPDLKYRPFVPAIPKELRIENESGKEGDFFAAIQRGDILLHHPYDSFAPVVDFLRAAARDPNVLAIKQTLYRVGSNSPVVKTLLQAARDYGKQVAVLVELKARFDEESNIGWARMLEREGVHVTYGLVGLKTHSKIALVVRKEGEHIRRYVHLATGNYNHVTAQLYEDFGMFTCDDEIGADATDLFNFLTGYSLKKDYRKLLVAPVNLRERLDELIWREVDTHKRQGNGRLIFKINSLVDQPMILLLYQASQAGVKIELIVRGMCSLRPGVPGLSDNIRVVSIVGRFLEHSRIFYFHNDGNEQIWMGSADLMPRNLNQRVEVLFPVEDKAMVRHLYDDVLSIYLADNVKAREMLPDGSYRGVALAEGRPEINAQEWFIEQAGAGQE
ncbi:MAG TPA: polyphosphate kinase 1 [Anaerolineaceae bacterium]|nr:polyphosphate kinase 1 [Anaerolineaceae bacterium]